MNSVAVQNVVKDLKAILQPVIDSTDHTEFEFNNAAAHLCYIEGTLFGEGVDYSGNPMGERVSSVITALEQRLTSQLEACSICNPNEYCDVDQLSELVGNAQKIVETSSRLGPLLGALANWLKLPATRAVQKEVHGLIDAVTDIDRQILDLSFEKGSLDKQGSAKKQGSEERSTIINVLLKVHESFKSIKDRPNIADALCEYILSATTIENERFFARELLFHFRKHHGKDAARVEFIDRCCNVAELLVTLEKYVPADEVTEIENKLDLPTRDPRCWLAVLDNLVHGSLDGENTSLVVRALKFNHLFSAIRESRDVKAKLEDLGLQVDSLKALQVHNKLTLQDTPVY
jgi:hypothetical protein